MKPGAIKLKTHPEVCQGCRSCEAVCSVQHYSAVSPTGTGIRVEEKEAMGTFNLFVCEQCFDMPCARACSAEVISRNSYSGAVEIGEDCSGCGVCVEACSFKAIVMSEVSGKTRAVKCDLCGGLPVCVNACPRQALSW
ncbi:MAG: 4Fe-4S dicluster domain-containing protein [Treponema sp.]|jgi:Fe-S-cluster-containing hydrogenase component 2|nr:4Fe-4S dicluster domain-containing protein [Treponema sp.]